MSMWLWTCVFLLAFWTVVAGSLFIYCYKDDDKHILFSGKSRYTPKGWFIFGILTGPVGWLAFLIIFGVVAIMSYFEEDGE